MNTYERKTMLLSVILILTIVFIASLIFLIIFGIEWVAVLLGFSSLAIGVLAYFIAYGSDIKINLLINTNFMTVVNQIGERNMEIIKQPEYAQLMVWLTRQDVYYLRDLMRKIDISPDSKIQLLNRFNALLGILTCTPIYHNIVFEVIRHLLQMEIVVLENIAVDDPTRTKIENTKDNIRTILEFDGFIPIDVDICNLLLDGINDDNRHLQYYRNKNILERSILIVSNTE